MNTASPDYQRIYTDIILHKFPEKKELITSLLSKNKLNELDIIDVNQKLFGVPDKETINVNQRHRSYSKTTIFKILEYQKKNGLNNSQLAIHYGLSRNTITKWKKIFLS